MFGDRYIVVSKILLWLIKPSLFFNRLVGWLVGRSVAISIRGSKECWWTSQQMIFKNEVVIELHYGAAWLSAEAIQSQRPVLLFTCSDRETQNCSTKMNFLLLLLLLFRFTLEKFSYEESATHFGEKRTGGEEKTWFSWDWKRFPGVSSSIKLA